MKLFNQVAVRKPKRSLFDLSHEKKLSTNLGILTPVMCEEIIPGDKFRVTSELLARLQPLQSPVMHRMDIYTHFFFVPNRILWSNWEKFITGGVEGDDAPVHPYFLIPSNHQDMQPGKLFDYLGYSNARFGDYDVAVTHKVNALPAAAYQKIVDDYFIDLTANSGPNLEGYELTDGDNSSKASAYYNLRMRSWQKDYFTSSLPFTQRGGDVALPVGGQVPVKLTSQLDTAQFLVRAADNLNPYPNVNLGSSGGALLADTAQGNRSVVLDPMGSLYADLNDNSMTTGTIEELRRASRLQEWLEKAARGGSRYVESIASFFGVRVPDYRLQRAEYLGGGKSPVVISEVLQTSGTTSDTAVDPLYESPLGDYAGHGVSVGNVHGFKRSFDEHGWIIGVLSIMPKPAYMQGYRRFFVKGSKFDYAFPDFAQLGEQPIYIGELYNDQEYGNDTETFAYQSRYAEYKFSPNTVHGDFKTNLDFWHMARKFQNKPTWNNTFIKYSPDDRIFANTDIYDHKFLIQIYHNVKAIRPLPYYNIPKL